jgi:AraC-like DNA-binding protein
VPYVTHVPPAPLRPFVAGAMGYRVPANPTGVHRGLPSRHLTLVVELAAPLLVAGLGPRVAAHGVVGGLHTRPALIDASGPQEGLQYALTLGAAGGLLGMPAAELHGQAVDLGDVFGPGTPALVEALGGTPDWAERFRLLDTVLVQRLDAAAGPGRVPAEVAQAWRLLFGSDGRMRIGAVAAHVGWSRRHLAEQFRVVTGLTPKQVARIARFEASRRLLLAAERPPLVDVAARCQYADQSHLAREWRALAGCSVGTWLREELPFVHDSEAGTTPGSRV